jgi:hypothetical protein
MVYGMITLWVTSISLLFVSASLVPGVRELSDSEVPLKYGFQSFTDLSENNMYKNKSSFNCLLYIFNINLFMNL